MFNGVFGLFCSNCIGSVLEKSYCDLHLFRFDILCDLLGISLQCNEVNTGYLKKNQYLMN